MRRKTGGVATALSEGPNALAIAQTVSWELVVVVFVAVGLVSPYLLVTLAKRAIIASQAADAFA